MFQITYKPHTAKYVIYCTVLAAVAPRWHERAWEGANSSKKILKGGGAYIKLQFHLMTIFLLQFLSCSQKVEGVGATPKNSIFYS